MSQPPVIAIGLDAADPTVVEQWLAAGHLPNLQRLKAQGAYGRLTNLDYHKAETPWTTFLTGCLPDKTGYWAPYRLQPGTYGIQEVQAYDYREYRPFYTVHPQYKVAAFDIPQSVLDESLDGLQVLAWGAHSPQTPSHSLPEQALAEIQTTHGRHPALHRDHGDWWDGAYLERLHRSLLDGLKKRVAICKDLLQRERWDLFLTIFGETHSAGHDLWYLSQPDHPLHGTRAAAFSDGDPMLDIFKATDRAIGEILEAAPADAQVVVFAAHGSGNNTTDVTSMFFLPEFLYRFSFPGKAMFSAGKAGRRVPPMVTAPRRKTWTGEIWQRKCEKNPLKYLLKQALPTRLYPTLDRWLGAAPDNIASPDELRAQGNALFWQPAMWYERLWPQMKAFAIPSFSEGYIRLNIAGREPHGIVPAAEYDALCEELIQELTQLVNPRTGKPIVKKVVRTRQSPMEENPKLSDADLVVVWAETPADVVDHPTYGRIGPVPYRRTGSHRERGFIIANSEHIAAGDTLAGGHGVDIAPTLLGLMGAPIPDYMDGKPLLGAHSQAPVAASTRATHG